MHFPITVLIALRGGVAHWIRLIQSMPHSSLISMMMVFVDLCGLFRDCRQDFTISDERLLMKINS